MKVSVLIAWLNDGTLHSVPSETYGPLEAMAKTLRKERVLTVGKKQVPVVQALVLSSNGGDARVTERIMCAAEAKREMLVAAAKAKAKAEADAKAKADKK